MVVSCSSRQVEQLKTSKGWWFGKNNQLNSTDIQKSVVQISSWWFYQLKLAYIGEPNIFVAINQVLLVPIKGWTPLFKGPVDGRPYLRGWNEKWPKIKRQIINNIMLTSTSCEITNLVPDAHEGMLLKVIITFDYHSCSSIFALVWWFLLLLPIAVLVTKEKDDERKTNKSEDENKHMQKQKWRWTHMNMMTKTNQQKAEE